MFPVAKAQILTTLSFQPEASERLSGLKATALMDLVCPVCRINSGLVPALPDVVGVGEGMGADGTPIPRFFCSLVWAMAKIGVPVSEIRITRADICRKQELRVRSE